MESQGLGAGLHTATWLVSENSVASETHCGARGSCCSLMSCAAGKLSAFTLLTHAAHALRQHCSRGPRSMVAAQQAPRTAAHALTVLLHLDTTSREKRRVPALPGGKASLLDCPGAVLGEGSIKCGVAEAVSVKCFNQLDTSAVHLLFCDGRAVRRVCA